MNKPPIKQKPVIKPKPPAKPYELLKGKLNDAPRNDGGDRDGQANHKSNDRFADQPDGKSGIFSEFDRLSQDSTAAGEPPQPSTFSQKVLDQSQLQKALQLLNQSGQKEDAQYDIRLDEDQIETCQQIITALLQAGYFRANIVGLSEFDKVSGARVCT